MNKEDEKLFSSAVSSVLSDILPSVENNSSCGLQAELQNSRTELKDIDETVINKENYYSENQKGKEERSGGKDFYSPKTADCVPFESLKKLQTGPLNEILMEGLSEDDNFVIAKQKSEENYGKKNPVISDNESGNESPFERENFSPLKDKERKEPKKLPTEKRKRKSSNSNGRIVKTKKAKIAETDSEEEAVALPSETSSLKSNSDGEPLLSSDENSKSAVGRASTDDMANISADENDKVKEKLLLVQPEIENKQDKNEIVNSDSEEENSNACSEKAAIGSSSDDEPLHSLGEKGRPVTGKKSHNKSAISSDESDEALCRKPTTQKEIQSIKKKIDTSDLEYEEKVSQDESSSDDEPLSSMNSKGNTRIDEKTDFKSLSEMEARKEEKPKVKRKKLPKNKADTTDSEEEDIASYRKKSVPKSSSDDEPLASMSKKGRVQSVRKKETQRKEKMQITGKVQKKNKSDTTDSEEENLAVHHKKAVPQSSSDDEPLASVGKKGSLQSMNKKETKRKEKLKVKGKRKKNKSDTTDSEEEDLASYRKKAVPQSSSDDEPLASVVKKDSFRSAVSKKETKKKDKLEVKRKQPNKNQFDTSDSEEEDLASYCKKSVSKSSSDDEPLASLGQKNSSQSTKKSKTKKQKMLNVKGKKQMKNKDDATDSEEEDLASYSKKSVPKSSSDDEPLASVVKKGSLQAKSKIQTTKQKIQKEKHMKKQMDSEDEDLSSYHKKSVSSDSSDEEPLARLGQKGKSDVGKKSNEESSELSASDEEATDTKQNKKQSKQKKSVEAPHKPSASEAKLEHLKKYVRAAGIRIQSYTKFFEGCKSMKSKVEKLMEILQKEGLKGRPTLEKCKKLKKKIETRKEIAELDVSNIITSRGRPKRTMGSEENDVKQNDKCPTPLIKKFSRLQDIIDSEESD